MGSPTTSTCSMTSCGSGRTTTITTVPTERFAGKPRTNDLSKRRELVCHRGLETLQLPFCPKGHRGSIRVTWVTDYSGHSTNAPSVEQILSHRPDDVAAGF